MMTSHDTSGSVTTLHGFGSVLGQHLDTFFLIGSHNSTVTSFGLYVKGWSETTRTHAQLQSIIQQGTNQSSNLDYF